MTDARDEKPLTFLTITDQMTNQFRDSNVEVVKFTPSMLDWR